MLPDIIPQDRKLATGHGIVLVGGGLDFEGSGFCPHQPGPAAAELIDAGGFEFFLEGIKAAEGLADGLADDSGNSASLVRAHNLPEHGVVHVAAAVVADYAANIFRQRAE